MIERTIKTEKDLILGGKIYWMYKGDMYVVQASAFNEMHLQPINAFDHAAGVYYV